MNDRFKFRAYDPVKKTYYYDDFYIMCDGTGAIYTPLEEGEDEDRLIIEQCTGLKDKNGRMIFEGDIVKVYSITGVIVRDEYGFLFKMGDVREPLRHFDNAKKTFEVVGDVHTWGKRGR